MYSLVVQMHAQPVELCSRNVTKKDASVVVMRIEY